MFCALKGATENPLRWSDAQSAVANQLFPLFEAVPRMEIAFMHPSGSCVHIRLTARERADRSRWQSGRQRAQSVREPYREMSSTLAPAIHGDPVPCTMF